MQTLKLALEDNPDYGLVITGHSLGGGVASLAAVELSCPSDLFRQQALRRRADTGQVVQHPRIYTPFVTSLDSGLPPGRPIHAYAYGVPAVSTPDLSSHCKGLVTSIIHGHDFIRRSRSAWSATLRTSPTPSARKATRMWHARSLLVCLEPTASDPLFAHKFNIRKTFPSISHL